MKKYWTFFRIRFINGLQYRAAALAGIATQFAWGFMEILLYAAFYRADPAAFPMSMVQTSAYIWLRQSFLTLLATWFTDTEVFAMITEGGVAYELCRPMSLYSMWSVRSMASRLSKAVLRCFPILLVALLVPAPYGLVLPNSWGRLALFLLSLLLGFFLVVSFCMLICISAFYTLSATGVRMALSSISEFLSGAVIPLPFLPDGLRGVVELLPFASMENTPYLIYGGQLSGTAALQSIALQALWVAALTLAGSILMQKALRRVRLQGG